MRFSSSTHSFVVSLLPLLLISLSGCGDSGSSNPGDPAGEWRTASIENVTQGIRVECPGVSGNLECGAATMSLVEDGTLTIIETADETGAPEPYRYEGIWRTEDNQLTLVLRDEGADADNLVPIDPPEEVTGPYTLSSDTLTLSGPGEGGDEVVATYDRL